MYIGVPRRGLVRSIHSDDNDNSNNVPFCLLHHRFKDALHKRSVQQHSGHDNMVAFSCFFSPRDSTLVQLSCAFVENVVNADFDGLSLTKVNSTLGTILKICQDKGNESDNKDSKITGRLSSLNFDFDFEQNYFCFGKYWLEV